MVEILAAHGMGALDGAFGHVCGPVSIVLAMPPWSIILVSVYGVMSIVSFVLYGWDKRAAARSGSRTRERTLLIVDALCGWPGGLVAQQVFRHKRKKRAYMLRFWAIVILHAVVLTRIVGRATGAF